MYFSQLLLQWYHHNQRALPWRVTTQAYQVWISEIILQQTRVDQGMAYFLRFMQAFPNVQALADAPLQQVLRLWQGLGYYSRARNLHKAARQLVQSHNGTLPDTYQGWLRIPGVGPYTAAAIASIAHGQGVPALDGNVYRVLARTFAIDHGYDTARDKRAFRDLAAGLIDPNHPGDFNQALMDLGALVCKPVKPDCNACPLNSICRAFAENNIDKYPVSKKKVVVRSRYFNYFLFFNKENGRFPVQRREEKDIWKNLFQLPLIETPTHADIDELVAHPQWRQWFAQNEYCFHHQPINIKHKLTHQLIHARFHFVEVFCPEKLNFGKDSIFLTLEDFDQLPKSRLIQKFFQMQRKVEW